MENPCGRSIYGGNPSPPPAVSQCRQSGQTGFCKPLLAREKKAPELDLHSLFYYSRTKLLFTATLCATARMIAVIPPPLASHQPKCLNLIQSDAYIHKIRAEGFKAVFGRGDSYRGETQSVPLSPLTRSCSLKAPEAKILSMRGSKLHWANLPIIVKRNSNCGFMWRAGFLRAGRLSIRQNRLPSFWGWKHERQIETVKITLEQREPSSVRHFHVTEIDRGLYRWWNYGKQWCRIDWERKK